VSDSRLQALDASGRAVALALVQYGRSLGLPLVVTSGRRSQAQQEALVPAAGLYKAVNSRHVLGRAFDLGFAGYRWQEVPWEYWEFLGRIWESAGGRWGGRFRKPDPIHFDW
jgi:hypothetical protein